MFFREVSHSRTNDAVTQQIETLVLDGVLRPGDRLPGERELAERFGVSRPVLGQALEALETRGLLVRRHGGGTYVADVIGEVFREPVIDLIRSRPKGQDDYLEYRREMDAVAAGLAARRATDGDRALLAALMEALTAAHEAADPAREAALDVEFHMAVSDCAHNVVLMHTARACYRLLADGVFYNRDLLYGHADCRERLFAQHRAIHDAIMAGDADRARAAAAAHMDYVAEAVEERRRAAEREAVAEQRLALAATRLQETRGRRGPAVGLADRPNPTPKGLTR